MIISAKKIAKIIEIQEKNLSKSEYFNQNRFLVFSMAIASKKKVALSEITKQLNLSQEEVNTYIETLNKYELLNQADTAFLKPMDKQNEGRNLNEEIDTIISHFNRTTNKNRKRNSYLDKTMKQLLKKGFTTTDFKTVTLYHFIIWGSDPTMSIHVSPDVFFRPTKFENKLETAREFFEKINYYEKETKLFCKKFTSRILIEFFRRDTINNNVCAGEKFTCQDMPISLKQAIIFWLDKYSIEEIIQTVETSIESFLNNPKFASHISLLKILDHRFPERNKVVRNKLEKQNKINKESVNAVGDWLVD